MKKKKMFSYAYMHHLIVVVDGSDMCDIVAKLGMNPSIIFHRQKDNNNRQPDEIVKL